jgi:hypothetical protein
MSDSVVISLAAKSMEGVDAADPKVTVDIMETSPISHRVSQQIVNNFNGRVTLNVPMPDGFPVWQVIVSFSRYDAVSGFFFLPRANPSPATFQLQVTRLPTAWTPRFTPLAALYPARFSPFKNVVAVSSNVDLKNGPAVGDLNANYDALSDPAQIQGKTALLNLFSVLTDEQDPVDNVPWFSHVKKFLRLDQERFVALVEPALLENVQTILNGLNGPFKGDLEKWLQRHAGTEVGIDGPRSNEVNAWAKDRGLSALMTFGLAGQDGKPNQDFLLAGVDFAILSEITPARATSTSEGRGSPPPASESYSRYKPESPDRYDYQRSKAGAARL